MADKSLGSIFINFPKNGEKDLKERIEAMREFMQENKIWLSISLKDDFADECNSIKGYLRLSAFVNTFKKESNHMDLFIKASKKDITKSVTKREEKVEKKSSKIPF